MVASILERPTLVLNRNWQPVHVATVARSLVLVWNDSARVVDPSDYQTYSWSDWARLAPADGEPFIRAVQLRLRVPEVVALVAYDRLPVAAVAFSRRNLFKRDHYTCQYCGVQPGSGELTIDHVVPRSRGGASSWENCVLACVSCNKRKADRTPPQAGMKLHKPPVRPKWKPHCPSQRPRIASWSKFISEAYWNVELE
jgi:5-methylcytosine-specific restriction endonuclease McrA